LKFLKKLGSKEWQQVTWGNKDLEIKEIKNPLAEKRN